MRGFRAKVKQIKPNFAGSKIIRLAFIFAVVFSGFFGIFIPSSPGAVDSYEICAQATATGDLIPYTAETMSVMCRRYEPSFCPYDSYPVPFNEFGTNEVVCVSSRNAFCALITGNANLLDRDRFLCASLPLNGECVNGAFRSFPTRIRQQIDDIKSDASVGEPNLACTEIDGRNFVRVPLFQGLDTADSSGNYENIDILLRAFDFGFGIRRGIGVPDTQLRFCKNNRDLYIASANSGRKDCYETNENRPCFINSPNRTSSQSSDTKQCILGYDRDSAQDQSAPYVIGHNRVDVTASGRYDCGSSVCTFNDTDVVNSLVINVRPLSGGQIVTNPDNIRQLAVFLGPQGSLGLQVMFLGNNTQGYTLEINATTSVIRGSSISVGDFTVIDETIETILRNMDSDLADNGYTRDNNSTSVKINRIAYIYPSTTTSTTNYVFQDNVQLTTLEDNFCKKTAVEVMLANSNKGCAPYLDLTYNSNTGTQSFTTNNRYNACVQCIYGDKRVEHDWQMGTQPDIDKCEEYFGGACPPTISNGDPANPNNEPFVRPIPGMIYTDLGGCVNTADTPSVVNTIFLIALSLMGFISVVRLMQAAVMIQSNDPEKIKEGQDIGLAAFAGLLLLILSVAFLNYLAQQVLQFGGPGGVEQVGPPN